MQYAKRAIASSLDADEASGLAAAREHAARLATSDDLAEGVRSFIERRNPVFRDTVDR
jgi:enoyl-CoA hydratase/carnithine racemase